MKSTGVFFAALFGLSFLVSAGMLVTATMKPEWFGMKQAHSDTLKTHSGADSTIHATAGRALPGEQPDSAKTASAEPQHNTPAAGAHEAAADEKEAPKVQPVLPAQTAQNAQAAQTVNTAQAKEEDLQNLVKLYEAMKPEDAAKILGKMPDKEVRSIILHVKKKQAAKILSYFDASKAAVILAQ